AQGRLPGAGGVAVVGGLRSRLDRRLDDVGGGREVRLARAEADHRASGGLQLLRGGIDGKGGRGGDRADQRGGGGKVGGGGCLRGIVGGHLSIVSEGERRCHCIRRFEQDTRGPDRGPARRAGFGLVGAARGDLSSCCGPVI